MSLRQQIIEDRIDETAKALGLTDKDMAFLRLAHSIITGQSIHAFDVADLVDGGQDKQIDTITIQETAEGEATVYILQAKNTASFGSNALIQMHNGFHWVFEKAKSDLKLLANQKFRDRIMEYRSTLSGYGPSNLSITTAFITTGHTSDLSDEFQHEAKAIRDEYDNGTFKKFELQVCGADELMERINAAEKKNKKIDAEIRVRYDANNPSLIKYHSGGFKGLVCSAPGREIARIVLTDREGFIFDSNVRKFLGDRGAVNSEIRNTCTSAENSNQFWFLNNGITIACDSFDPVTDPDNPHIKVKNVQIVNGCQTATTLAEAALNKELKADVYVLLRIYEAGENSLVNRLVLTTNNQNRISSRDLRANEQVQIEMQERFAKFNLHYERKIRQFDNAPGVVAARIAANELVAQSYLAIVLKKPSDARRRKYKVWGELYDKIFTGGPIEPYVISFLLYRLASQWLQSSGKTTAPDGVTRRLAKNGAFHVARIAGFRWRGGDDWSGKDGVFATQIKTLEDTPADLGPFFENGLKTFKRIIKATPHYKSDIDGAMKSNMLDSDIDRHLYKSRAKRQAKAREAT